MGPRWRQRPLSSAAGASKYELQPERRANDAVLLAQVRGGIPLARARAPRPSRVHELHGVRLRLLETVADGAERSHVLRLLLHPDELAQARVAAQQIRRLLHRERIQLLEARDRNALRLAAPLVAGDVVVDLARAQDETRRALAVGRGVVEERPERAGREVVERRRRLLQPQQALRRHHDERARSRVEGLPAEEMEVLRRRRAIGDADVLLRRQLQEALEAGARMLGAVALVAVRKQQRQPRRLAPLREAGGDELGVD